ncbi:glycoside hydrolase family protein [Solicola gregarius]|uniref:Glycoside hydrolase n=1 Tax=Solicola gregarius TaxID=2908642 RepID=A0AA46TIE9_9ACTN|nr:glycoside hydrolase [Solicola gregarius]UYM05917.1 glycoside hydrolase [Solicola gregarius]
MRLRRLRWRAVLAILTVVSAAATVTAPAATSADRPASGERTAKVVQKPYERVDRGVGAGERFRIYDPSVGESKQWYINDHTFVQGPDGTWHMFGITHEEPANPLDETYFAHATADSLTQEQWVKQEPVMHADPDSGETHVWAPYVMEHDGTYYMFYAGGTDDHERYRMQLATSTDLYHWERHPENPLFTDGYDARDPMVLRVGDQWVMYYTANSRPDGGHHIVAYRTSDDLVHWSERGVALKHPVTGTFGGPTESPYVVQDGDDYYLSTCCTSNYTDTRVYHSNDPLHFDVSDEVGQIDEHASEIVRDGDDLYVSGAGWGQGGLYLRPLDLDKELVTEGRIIKTGGYRLDLQTAPHASIRSMDVRARGGWRRVLNDDFRATAPYLAVGNFGSTDPAGKPRRVAVRKDGRRLALRGVPLGDEPARVDWRFRFSPSTSTCPPTGMSTAARMRRCGRSPCPSTRRCRGSATTRTSTATQVTSPGSRASRSPARDARRSPPRTCATLRGAATTGSSTVRWAPSSGRRCGPRVANRWPVRPTRAAPGESARHRAAATARSASGSTVP